MQNSSFFQAFSMFFQVNFTHFWSFSRFSKVLLATLDKIVRHCSLTVLATAPCPIPITAGVRSISYSPKLLKQLEIPTEISDMSRSPRRGSRVLPLQLPTTGPPVPDRGAGCQRSSSPPWRSLHQTGEQGAAPTPPALYPIPRPGVSPLPEFLTSPFSNPSPWILKIHTPRPSLFRPKIINPLPFPRGRV